MSRFSLLVLCSNALLCLAVLSGSPISIAAEDGASQVTKQRVVYQKVGNLELYLDLYLPQRKAPPTGRPAVIWLHGGGWSGGSPDKFAHQAQVLASQGLVSASVRYRLLGEASYPAGLSDCKCAVRYLRANAGRYGVDPQRIVVGGGSAGGHLAAMVGLTSSQYEGDGPYREVSSAANLMILFNGAFDLRSIRHMGVVKQLAGSEQPSDAQLIEVSPVGHVSKDAPPTLILHGDSDNSVPYSQAVAFRDALCAQGVKADLFTAKGKGHAWFHSSPDFEITMAEIIKFLKANGFWVEG